MLSTSRSKLAVLSRFGYAVTSNLPSHPRGNRAFFNSCVVVRQMALLGPNLTGMVQFVVRSTLLDHSM